jgi:hypothetical protein
MTDHNEVPEAISPERYALGLFAEEAGEVLQWVGKTLRFGFDTPGRKDAAGVVTGETPRTLMPAELGDFLAAIDFAAAHGMIDKVAVDAQRVKKLAKLLDPASRDNLGHQLAPQPSTEPTRAEDAQKALMSHIKATFPLAVKAGVEVGITIRPVSAIREISNDR